MVGVLLSRLTGGVETIDDKTLPFVLTVDEMDLSRSDVQQFLTDVSATHDPDGYKDAEASAQRFQADVEKFRTRYKADGDSEGLRQLDSLEADFHHFYDLGKAMAAAYVAQGMEAGNQLMKGSDKQPGFDAASEALLEKMRGFRKRQVDEAHQITAEARHSAVLTRDWMLGGSLVSMLLAAILGGWIVRNIIRQLGGELHDAVELARRVAQGHLQTSIEVQPGDSESLMAQLQSMQESLSQIVGQVREGAESVASASAQIAHGNHDLSTRTAHQASGLEETAASTEQLGATVKQNADNAREANQVALQAAEVAENGGALVGQVVDTMKGINDSSRKIADIIGVIDGIAFQTNIL
ncbi:MAG: hypothetical protein JOY84_19740, partial [Curvibacter sp.]|nr:hypothetical protein [Curvibacter sp.]